MHKIPVLTIRFANDLSLQELPFFRGAIISKVPADLVLFHNHTEDALRYRYPLIQYKRINGKAAIVCLGEGTEAIGSFFAGADFNLQIGNRSETFSIESVRADQWLLQTWNNHFAYTARKWLPFNSANYDSYRQLQGVVEKVQFLERILVGNILSMCTGLGVHLDQQVACKITSISNEQTYAFKKVPMQGMDIAFTTNIFIPNYLALGKGVSHGFGVLKHTDKKITSNIL